MQLTVKKFLSDLKTIEYILIFIAILVAGFAFFFFQRSAEHMFVEMISTPQQYRENAFPPEYWEVNEIKKGDAGYNSLGKKEVEVLEVVTDEWGGQKKRIKIKLKLAVTFDKRMSAYLFQNKPLVIGQNFELVIGNSLFNGTVVNFNKNLEDFDIRDNHQAVIKVKVREIESWHAEAMSKINVTNSKGEQVLEVKDFKIEPAEIAVVTDKGDILKRWDPIKKDILLTLHVYKVNCSGDVCYFNDIVPLKQGSYFWTHSDKTFIDGGSIVEVTIL